MDLKALEKKLIFAEIDYSQWGVGITKTPAELLDEVHAKVTKVEFMPDGRFVRQPLKVHIDVYWYAEDGTLMFLTEVVQIFPGLIMRKRPKDRSVSEKFSRNEGKITAAVRALLEELGIRVNRRHLIWTATGFSDIEPSHVYPGMYTQSVITYFVYFMTKKNYQPFYTEFKKGRLSIFMWRVFTGWKKPKLKARG